MEKEKSKNKLTVKTVVFMQSSVYRLANRNRYSDELSPNLCVCAGQRVRIVDRIYQWGVLPRIPNTCQSNVFRSPKLFLTRVSAWLNHRWTSSTQERSPGLCE